MVGGVLTSRTLARRNQRQAVMAEASITKRATFRAILTPAVLFPAGLGGVVSLMALFTGTLIGPSGFVGLGLLAVAAATAGYRFFFRRPAIARQLAQEAGDERLKTTIYELRELRRRLRADGDPRMIGLADSLRKVHQRLAAIRLAADNPARDLLPDLRSKADALWANCLTALRRASELSRASDQMSTGEGRRRMIEARESLVDEAERSVRHLGATLDHLQAASLDRDRPDESLARIREELEQGLEVSRRVEERMKELDRDIDPENRIRRHRLES